MEAAPVHFAIDEKVLVGNNEHQAFIARPMREGDDKVLVRWESTGAREEVAVGDVKKIDLEAKRPTRGKRREASGAEAAAPARREPPRKRRKKTAEKSPSVAEIRAAYQREQEIERHVNVLQSGDADGKKAAIEALKRLAPKGFNANCAPFVQRLVGLLSGDSADDKENAAKALFCFSQYSPSNCAAIVEAGGIEALVALVRNGATGGQEAAAVELMTLAWYNRANCAVIAAAGGIEALVALVRNGAAGGQEKAAAALGDLARDETVCTAIVAAKGIEALLALVENGATGGQGAAASALRSLACGGQQVAIVAAGGVEALSALLPGGALGGISWDVGKEEARLALEKLGPLAKYASRLQSENASLQRRLDRYEGSGAIDVTQDDDDDDDDAQHRDTGLRDLRDRKARAHLVKVKEEKEALEDRVLCKICVEADAPRTVLFEPCNHFLACASCADALQECPNCRVPITARTSITNTS